MIHPNDIQEANEVLDEQDTTASLPTLQEQIDAQRKLVYESDLEVRRCTEALNIAEQISVRRHSRLGELLNLRDLQKAQENAIAVGPQIPRW